MSQEKPGTPEEPKAPEDQPETTPSTAADEATAVPAEEVPVAPVAPGAAAQAGYGAAAGYGLSTAPATEVEDYPVITAARADGPSLGARIGAEALGTFVLLLAGLGTALYASASGVGTLGSALAFGLGAGAAHLMVGAVSGGHFNPAITLGSVLAGRTRAAHLAPYWVAQLIGGALATAVLYVTMTQLPELETIQRQFFAGVANGYDTHSPLAAATSTGEGFSLLAALLVEVVVTAVLVGVVLSLTGRARLGRGQAAAGYGAALAVAVLIATPITNAGLNPARSIAAAIFSESWAWGQIWVFIVGPLVGGLLAALLYRGFGGGAEEDELDEELADDVLIEEEVVVVEGR
ncbi:aquaporin [Cellulomonas denverensis]|uniref:MIP family channel protein n=1 Tax=Cellulomonas denverensis TaxID=264297 RepID=A0A7X6R0P4_9CELL|nr:aquaporin [Cellulomonas denverensis]NKY24534.1 MIP family channel protein [Cellulomonas denverensis]GIG26282.1 hypothetical protein Cde04nite_25260 [Cellulomonas denverensis]